MEKIAEKEVMEACLEARVTRSASVLGLVTEIGLGSGSAEQKRPEAASETAENTAVESVSSLRNKVKKDLDIITMVANKSSNLKGGLIKNLKEAVKSIASAIEIMATRSSNEEIVNLEKENNRLKISNKILKSEIESLKADVREMSNSLKEIKRGMLKPQDQESPEQFLRPLPETQDMEVEEINDRNLAKKYWLKIKHEVPRMTK